MDADATQAKGEKEDDSDFCEIGGGDDSDYTEHDDGDGILNAVIPPVSPAAKKGIN